MERGVGGTEQGWKEAKRSERWSSVVHSVGSAV